MRKKDAMDIKFEKGLFYLTEKDHVNIKKAIYHYITNKQYDTAEQWDDMLQLFGDLNRSNATKEMDDDWL
jgi:hypothetical protein